MNFLKPQWAVEWLNLLKQAGFREFVKQKGWKVVFALILFYLIRDSVLYIIIPYFAVTKIGGCG